MKKKNWYRSLSLADDKYVEEARPDRVIKPKRSKALAFIAACACFALPPSSKYVSDFISVSLKNQAI